jgi:hypothetical protein
MTDETRQEYPVGPLKDDFSLFNDVNNEPAGGQQDQKKCKFEE